MIASRRFLECLLALAALIPAIPAGAMDPNRAMSQYIHDRWSTDRGFPGGDVEAITQTADGYLWIGTDKGLVQFDGLTFRPVTDPGAASPPIVNVLGLAADANGSLLVRLQGRNLLHYTNGAFENALWPLRPREVAVTAMYQERDGAVLMSGLAHGVLRYRGNQFETLVAVTALPRSPITAIAESSDGTIWLGTRDEGLFSLARGRVAAITAGLPSPEIGALLAVGQDVWIGTAKGVVRWDGQRIAATGVPAALQRSSALSMLSDRGGNLWVGTADGLFRVNASGIALFDRGAGVPQPVVTALFEDREGNLWAGSQGAVERLRDSPFITYSPAQGMPAEQNGPIHVDDEGRIWFGPSTGGLYWLNGRDVHHVADRSLDADVVYSIAGQGNDLWVGRQHGGLTHLRLAPGAGGVIVSSETIARTSGLADNSVFAVHISRDATVWAGTFGRGASAWRDGRLTTYTASSGLGSDTVTAILGAADGTTWFGTANGLASLRNGQWHTYRAADGLPSDDINCLFEDRKGAIWIGTSAGLAFLDGGRVREFARLPALLRDQIVGVAEDRRGRLWMATLSHLLQVDRQRLFDGALAEGDVRDYGLVDGLRSPEGVKRQRSVVADGSGRIWFSTSGGLSVIDPEWTAGGAAPPPTRIAAISIDDSRVSPGANLRIAPGHRRIMFSYSGVSLSVPERVRFKYKLDGFDRDWSQPVSTREAAYTNLGPGDYRIRVVSSNSEGLWNGDEAVVLFHVDPAFWQTWWFRLAMVLTLGAAGMTMYRVRLRLAADRLNERFQERLAERTRIAQELHDTLLQGFVSASMQLHVATNRLPAESPARPPLHGVAELMGQVINEGRNAVRGLRTPADQSTDDLEQAFCRIQQQLSGAERSDFRVVVEGKAQVLHPMIHDEVYRIGREALMNALRHSAATSIEVEIDYARNQFRLMVRDNGRGVDASVLRSGREGHWGLSGMRERADRIGARLRLWSREGAGTEVDLIVPARVAYRSLRQRSWLTVWRPRRTNHLSDTSL